MSTLLSFPPETDIITEVVHGASRTMDSRHFAEEFVRRRALADKGKMDSMTTVAPQHIGDARSAASGWSEVARKGSGPTGHKSDDTGAFKVVAAKKKAGKK